MFEVLVWLRGLPERVTGSRWLRAALALLILAGHLAAMTAAGRSWLKVGFNSVPKVAPAFPPGRNGLGALSVSNRLLAARWDSSHYIGGALRGFDHCPKQDLRKANLIVVNDICDFKFYPTYPWMGRQVARLTGLAADYSLLGISLLASALLLYLWTSPPIVRILGSPQTLLSLMLFATFPSAFYLVSVHTESLTILTGFAAFLALRNRSYLWGALVAGASTGVHFRALGFGLAYGAALLVSFVWDRPRGLSSIAARLLGLVLSGWGVFVLWGYYAVQYHDPLLYLHSVEAGRWFPHAYNGTYAASIFMSMKQPYAGPVLMIVGLVAALGIWDFLKNLTAAERAFVIVALAFLVGAPLFSRKGDFMGMQRYVLCAFPIFFAVARALRGRILALGGWTTLSLLHYWHVELCLYLSYTTSFVCPCWSY